MAAVGYKNVGGLDIAMNDPFAVGCIQSVCHLSAQRERRRDIERLSADVLTEGLALEKFHDQKGMPGGFSDIVDGADIGMVKRGRSPGLALKAFPSRNRRKSLRQNFHGHVALEPCVPRAIDLAHAALADGGENLVGTKLVAFGKRHTQDTVEFIRSGSA